jgi:hypothetical protein
MRKKRSREDCALGRPVYSSLRPGPLVLSDMVAVHIPGPEGVRVIGIAVAARLPGRSVRLMGTGLSLISGVSEQKPGAVAVTAISIVAV